MALEVEGTVPDYNAVDFKNYLLPECYVSFTLSLIFFTTLFILAYYILMPICIHPSHQHIKETPFLHWKIINTSISLIHCLIILSLLFTLTTDVKLLFSTNREVIDSPTPYTARLISSISIGYFIYDTIVNCIIFSKKHTGKYNNTYIFHHIVTIIGLSMAQFLVYSGGMLFAALGTTEISTPILHINNMKNKFIPRQQNQTNKKLLLIDLFMKTLYLLIYSIARFIFMTYMTYQLIFVYKHNMYIQLQAVALVILSIALLPGLLKDINKTYIKYKNANSIQYDKVDKVDKICADIEIFEKEIDEEQSTASDIIHDCEDELDTVQNEYEETLSLSKQMVAHFFVAGVVYTFFHTNRMAVYMLYAEEFSPTQLQITFLLYGYNFWNGLASLLYASLANQYGYDFMLILLLILQCVAVLLESIASSFYVLFAGIMLGQVSITYIVFGCIAWFLPHDFAKRYTSFFYASFMVSYLIGPMAAGLVSFYVSNRTVFVVNLGLCLCALVHALIFIANKQRKLESKQLMVGLIEEKDDNEQFPICVIRFQQVNDNIQNKWYKLPTLSFSEWFMLISILLINSTVSIAETAFVIYYTLYVVQNLNGNVIEGTSGLVVISISFIAGNLIVPKWFGSHSNTDMANVEENVENIHSIYIKKLMKNKYFVMILCLMILLLHTIYIFPMIQSVTYSWIFDFTVGLPLGVLSMTSEIIILEIQPTKDSGKISGAKGLLRNWLKALTLLIMSFLWNSTHKSFYFVVATTFVVALLFTFAMVSLKCVVMTK